MAADSNVLDMALDDIISQSGSNRRRQTNTRGGGFRGGSNINRRGGGFRSGGNTFSRPAPYSSRPRGGFSYDQQSQPVAPRGGSRNHLVVSNLHYNVTETDLYELFGQIGPLKRAYLHLAPTGGSAGVADIIFAYPPDAERAIATYNNVELDGRPMRISYAIQPNVPVVNGVYAGGGPARRTTRGGYNRQSGGRGFRGGNRRRNDPRPRPTEAELDAEMDSYMSVPNEDTTMQ